MPFSNLQESIIILLRQKKATLLTHYCQCPEVQEIYACLTGMTHIVTLPEEMRLKALSSLEKMLTFAKSPPIP